MLSISTRGRYASRIMVCLALRAGSSPSRKQDIARAEAISADYVEQILMRLKAAGLVRSHRGAKGGFSLARDPARVTVAEILRATEGPIALAPCEEDDCERTSICVTRGVWQRASAALERIFEGTTVADLTAEARRFEAHRGPMFEI